MNKTMDRWKLAALLSLVLLGACGGGGDGAPAAQAKKAEGVYGGTLSGSPTSTAFQLLVLENDEYWAMYGDNAGGVFLVEGFVQGTGASSNGSFTSSNLRDFGYAPAVAGSVGATYNASTPSISGTISAPSGSIGFSGGAIAGSLYDYDAGANLSSIVGNWSLTDLAGAPTSLVIASNGAFTATSNGCSFSGTVTPRASGKNVFDVALTFGGSPCLLAGQSATGIALAYPLAGGSTQLLVAAHNAARTNGTAAVGTR